VYNINIDKIDPLPTDVAADNTRVQANEHLA
jgi:hypothetical protein